MIEVYKILRQMYDSSVAPNLQLSNTGVTRGNKYKLLIILHPHIESDERKSLIITRWSPLAHAY